MSRPTLKTYNGEPVKYAHLKRDGHWLTIVKDTYGCVRCFTRTDKDVTAKIAHCPFMLPIHSRVPPDMTLYGELWYPGKPASYVSTALAEGSNALRFDMFASPMYNRSMGLEILSDNAAFWGLQFAPFCRVSVKNPATRLVDKLIDDQEGWVFKNGNLLDWYRWKRARTIDLIVIGTKEGKGKHTGLVGALVCAAMLPDNSGCVEVANVGSGLSDAARVAVTELNNDDDLVGRVCEVSYQYVGAAGRLRHPCFERLRDDKTQEECGLVQDEDLLAMYS